MYSIDDVKTFMRQAIELGSETNKIEFKDARKGLSVASTWRSITAFSNTPQGGAIVFGVEEDSQRKLSIVGGLQLATLQEQVAGHMRDAIANAGDFRIEPFTYEGETLLALIIAELPTEKKPCYLKNKGLPNGACLREGNSNRTITEEEMKSFIRNNKVYKFDRTKAGDLSIESLSFDKIGRFLEKSASRRGRDIPDDVKSLSLLKNLGIVDKYARSVHPTVGGYLIFSKDVPQLQRNFARYLIRCIKYKGSDVSTDIIDKQDIEGRLDEQIDLTHQFILRNTPLSARIQGTKRIEEYEYPEKALREVVANAIIHRDYVITETYTQVNLFDNRIEISNPGCLPPGISVENIKDSQFSRNEVMASTLKDLDYLEEYGRGIDIVFSEMKRYGLPEPQFKNESNKFTVTLFGAVFKQLNDRQLLIWNTMQRVKIIAAKDCVGLFPGVSRPTINNDIKKLVELGIIEQKGYSIHTHYILRQ